MYSSKKSESVYFLMADTFLLCISLTLSIYLNGEDYFHKTGLLLFLGLPVLWFVIVYSQKLYFPILYRDRGMRVFNFLKSCVILILSLGLVYLVFTFPPNFRNAILAFSIGFPIAGLITNSIAISIINRVGVSPGHLKNSISLTVDLDDSDESENDGDEYAMEPHSDYGIAGVQGVASINSSKVGKRRIADDVQYIEDYLNGNQVDEILLTLSVKPSQRIKEICKIADHHGARVRIVPDYQFLVHNNHKAVQKPMVLNARPMPLDDTRLKFLKESFDWIFSGLALLFLAPVFLAIAILIKLDSPRPVFYCPTRIGKGGRPFKLYKFSTMRNSDPEDGGTNSTQKNDPRITPLGKVLRKYSLDELPQFINVFLGNMSVIGPRPHRSYLNQQFQASEGSYMVRHYYKPGITGWAQVNGWRGPTGTPEQKHQRTVHDLWYLENWSFKLDIRIVFMTIFSKKTHNSTF